MSAAAWPPCASTDSYARWRDEQLAAARPLTDEQRHLIVAAVVADRKPAREAS